MTTPGLAPHPETPNLEVPLGLFDGVRTWLQFLLGFMFLYLFFLVISPDVSRHHSAFWMGVHGTVQTRSDG